MGMRIPALMSKQGIMSSNLVMMGPTGSGKSRLSIDLATHFPNSEIINSDKIQLHQGLDILTNKITPQDQRGIPHHLLGITTTPFLDIPLSKFCHMASLAAATAFQSSSAAPTPTSKLYSTTTQNTNVACCGWTLRCRYSIPLCRTEWTRWLQVGWWRRLRACSIRIIGIIGGGIRKAIGVHELDTYLRACSDNNYNSNSRNKLLQEGIAEIKANSCELACRQLKKILRLRNVKGWNIHRVDATEAF
ncbi:unnamed protein product [Citrullus colocynthis]|uniref:Uncharacterized protein n=1 Tax=Citrullus colocynthis TaxID=252529 RepID=A0ABP0YV27_9ROSI